MLLDRGGDGDREKAMALLDGVLAISQEPGMRPLLGASWPAGSSWGVAPDLLLVPNGQIRLTVVAQPVIPTGMAITTLSPFPGR